MRFFVPTAEDDPVRAEHIYDAARREAAPGRKLTDRRIHRLVFSHEGTTYTAEVGQPAPRIGEPVFAILESDDLYFVCTPTRGALAGDPYLVGKNEVRGIVDFEE